MRKINGGIIYYILFLDLSVMLSLSVFQRLAGVVSILGDLDPTETVEMVIKWQKNDVIMLPNQAAEL